MSRLYDEPVKNTCPDIDYIISCVNQALLDLKSESSPDSYTYEERCNDAIYQLQDVEEKLEQLRSANSALRDWGNELVAHAQDLEEKLEGWEETWRNHNE